MAGQRVMRISLALVLAHLWGAPAATAAADLCDTPPPAERQGAPKISASFAEDDVVVVGEHRGLRIRKRIVPGRWTTIEIRLGRDVVTFGVSSQGVSVERAGRTVHVDSEEAMQGVQHLLAGSPAVFATRALLSSREQESDLSAPEMALLSAAAFVAATTGDTDAPRRLTARFIAKHRGPYRAARLDGSCWQWYAAEVSAAWNDLQACMDEAADDGWFSGAVQRLACNGVWLVRADSAFFEYMKCLSPLGVVPKVP